MALRVETEVLVVLCIACLLFYKCSAVFEPTLQYSCNSCAKNVV